MPQGTRRPSKTSPPAAAATARLRGLAAKTDRYLLYQRAVQCVEAEIDFVDETFTKLRGRKAVLLREDFCGTLHTSCEWIRRRKGNIAVGVDLDPVPLEWGKAHNVAALSPEQRARLYIHQGDVLEPAPRPKGFRAFDAVLAMNFSFWCFTTRAMMLRYFKGVHAGLAGDGVFFLDFYGGSDALKELRERRKVPRVRPGEEGYEKGAYSGPFTYIWDQASYDPITGGLTCHIHFNFPDGSKWRKAFSYHWRLWTLPEIKDILTDAGFKRVTVYWEGDDAKGGGNGVFTASEHGEACPSFICYITAEK